MTTTKTIEAFTATRGNTTVVVRQDDDLAVQFKRGEVARANSGNIQVAMLLGIDDEPVDLVLFHGTEVCEALCQIREAVELALEGLNA